MYPFGVLAVFKVSFHSYSGIARRNQANQANCIDLSTLHALRDRTLSHTHSLLAHLIGAHSIPSSYRLLARSAITHCSSPNAQTLGYAHAHAHKSVGWGCIRLAPSVVSPSAGNRSELGPRVRRSSMDFSDSPSTSPRRASAWLAQAQAQAQAQGQGQGQGQKHERSKTAPVLLSAIGPSISAPNVRSAKGLSVTREGKEDADNDDDGDDAEADADVNVDGIDDLTFDDAVLLDTHGQAEATGEIQEDDEDRADAFQLKEGYISGSVSDDEEEDADEVVLREIERRGAKEG